jgi:hypothetical protein
MMVTPHSFRRSRLGLALGGLLILASQSGCEEQAPATEPEARIEAQKKRAETLRGEIGYAPPGKALRAVRRR